MHPSTEQHCNFVRCSDGHSEQVDDKPSTHDDHHDAESKPLRCLHHERHRLREVSATFECTCCDISRAVCISASAIAHPPRYETTPIQNGASRIPGYAGHVPGVPGECYGYVAVLHKLFMLELSSTSQAAPGAVHPSHEHAGRRASCHQW